MVKFTDAIAKLKPGYHFFGPPGIQHVTTKPNRRKNWISFFAIFSRYW